MMSVRLGHLRNRYLLASVMALLSAAPAATQKEQEVLPPIARYTVDAGTVSGMAAMAGRGGLGSALAMMSGGGGQPIHELVLRLGSTRAPTGAPQAQHFMPPGARLGQSVELRSPERASAPGQGGYEPEMPKGRLLIYWGCGAHAPKNQPVVIDFAKVAKGEIPAGLYAAPINVPGDWSIKPSNSTTYGDWPNSKDRKTVTADASLIGAHKITSSYAPEIGFNLTQDFMPALSPRSADQPDGSIMLSWDALAPATGYYAWVFSTKGGASKNDVGDIVWWASSSTQQFGGPMWDWISPAGVSRLIAAKTVMPPSQTSCQVPAEVKQAGGQIMMGSLYAYGPQADFASPARPKDPKIAWKPDWITRVRYRSSSMWMLGMAGMGGAPASSRGETGSNSGGQSEPKSSGLPKCKGLGGLVMKAKGLCQ